RAAIRHFHTCQASPDKPGRWLVSSGDAREHCRLWITENGGWSWEEIRLGEVTGIRISGENASSLIRHTSEVWEADDLYWGTDDRLRRDRAAFVRFNIPSRSIDVLGDLGENETRSLVPISAEAFVTISEAKFREDFVQVYLASKAPALQKIIEIPSA